MLSVQGQWKYWPNGWNRRKKLDVDELNNSGKANSLWLQPRNDYLRGPPAFLYSLSWAGPRGPPSDAGNNEMLHIKEALFNIFETRHIGEKSGYTLSIYIPNLWKQI